MVVRYFVKLYTEGPPYHFFGTANMDTVDLDTGAIKEWRSIVTLIVFVIASKWVSRSAASNRSFDNRHPGALSTAHIRTIPPRLENRHP